MRLRVGLAGTDLPSLVRALPGRWVPKTPPPEFSVEFEDQPAGDNWLDKAACCTEMTQAKWKDVGEPFLIHTARIIVKTGSTGDWQPQAVLSLLVPLPFTVASFDTAHPSWEKGLDAYEAPGFGYQHYSHGWACAFKGTGHDALVSRRWLEHGPWRVLKGADDTTLVQFHDLAADSATALAQAKPGHERMGITRTGGYLPRNYTPQQDLQGVYDSKEKSLRIVVHGRDVAPGEMLDACAARQFQLLGQDKTVQRVAYVFMEPARAQAHLHELWLHDLECWTIELGKEIRLDKDYKPTPVKPDWVKAVEARESRR
ncbi:hypothetical protein POL68_25775 [Stigmatella sp. ncwal1]|uniref:Uncharacterized protein n=1 Tax=Stigmatella ashevillensis TaxID=2995309 RepID=A0ABT5DGK5_9BACT|nr:hypothetical protein [Stigmatella ashevillena]MDC0711903.1 hypothetical protein [Stigmatella ashevillena]